MAEHKNITDPDNHEPKGASIAVDNTVYVSDGAGSGVWKKPPIDVSSLSMERLVDGVSVAATQNPTSLGDAGAIGIEFGPAVGSASDPVNLLASGILQINEGGLYRIKIALQFGRVGGAGTSEMLFRVSVGGVQTGRSIAFKIDNADETKYFENDTWIVLPSNVEICFEVMRDSSGNNSGGLIQTIPTGTWNTAPSSALRVERLS